MQEILHEKYYYAKTLKLPYYGADLHEPIIKICKRILEHPNRFSVVKKGVVGSTYHYTDALVTTYHLHSPIGIEGPQVLIDKDTKQKFVFEDEKCKNLSFLTDMERRFLYTVVMEWWQDEEERLKEKALRKAQKQKEKFRQELIDVYKDY